MAKAKKEGEAWSDAYVVQDYERVLDPYSLERRVLGYITDMEHGGTGPRNTVETLAIWVARDEYAFDDTGHYEGDEDEMQGYVDELVDAGLVIEEDDRYKLTEAGLVELVN